MTSTDEDAGMVRFQVIERKVECLPRTWPCLSSSSAGIVLGILNATRETSSGNRAQGQILEGYWAHLSVDDFSMYQKVWNRQAGAKDVE